MESKSELIQGLTTDQHYFLIKKHLNRYSDNIVTVYYFVHEVKIGAGLNKIWHKWQIKCIIWRHEIYHLHFKWLNDRFELNDTLIIQKKSPGTTTQFIVRISQLPFRSRFLAPMVVCVVIFVSILTVWRLFVSREIITLCQWLSFRGVLEFPLMRWAPFPRSDT